uniref:Ribosomal protein S6 kinase like 1 n=1 Tax=Nothobranchius furzeri TaxID=105023 RepID=A0A8C6M036_NOTFU
GVRSRPCSHSRYSISKMAKRDYLVEAAKQIHMALDSEVREDYEAAFSYYKNSVDLLLNGVQLDPNKERREAVKRKTTQYLKRAEEIFITHLQDNLGRGNSRLGGYSSLRFRPIRHLSSPVEDLEMCKLVGVSDKVLVVQSMVNKEKFVVKSLVKSSWESRDQPTIIPQGVPYMVKLLRYYVSEDAVYLHLEHVKGEMITSVLRGMLCEFSGMSLLKKTTGCLQNTRSAASFYTKLDQLTLLSGLTRTQLTTHIHPPRSYVGWFSSGSLQDTSHGSRKDSVGSLKPEGSDRNADDQIIEVDGWCHLPQFPAKTPRPGDNSMQTYWGLPEAEVRVWGAQILLALESLHQQGILCRDLNPRNILLTSNGKVCLTFFSQWSEVQSEISSKAMEKMYCAPEIGGVSKITEACDWWSLGALLFELLTGMPLWQLHPAGIHSHTQLVIPDHLSAAAASLLTELLQFDAGYRLGSGGGGVSDIKCHPFFSSVSWKALSC